MDINKLEKITQNMNKKKQEIEERDERVIECYDSISMFDLKFEFEYLPPKLTHCFTLGKRKDSSTL
jgi:hypothetical protein